MPVVDLKVDRKLLCPNFDGYKLSLEAVPVLRQDFNERKPLKVQLPLGFFSLLHVDLFGTHNLLTADPWERTNSYFINDAHEVVLCSYDSQNGRPHAQRVVYTMERNDHGDGGSQVAGDYNYSMRFISEKYCILCDGMNTLHLLDTGNRLRAAQWQLLSRTPANCDSSSRGCLLFDARLDVVQEIKQISIAVGSILRHETEDPEDLPVYSWKLAWGRWSYNDVTKEWDYCVKENFHIKGVIHYCAFEPRAESLVISSNCDVMTEQERLEKESKLALDANNELPEYKWTQTEEEIIIIFTQRGNMCFQAVNMESTNNHLTVKALDKIIFDDELYACVDQDLSSYTSEPDCIAITLSKREKKLWPQLLKGNNAPPECVSELEAEEERLPIPNLEEPIEDCDLPLESSGFEYRIVRFNLPAREVTHTIYLGQSPPLFATGLRPGFPAAFVTRDGVDANLWLQVYQPSKPDEWNVRHEGTLHAFGYVQASKDQRKFMNCSPDMDYSVIAETNRHVFIYRSRYDTAEGLRKRNGPPVTIGKQSLITLDEHAGQVLGLTTASNVITLLTENAVLFLQV